MGLMLLLLPLAVLVWSRLLVLAAEVAAVGAAVGTVDFTGVFCVIVGADADGTAGSVTISLLSDISCVLSVFAEE